MIERAEGSGHGLACGFQMRSRWCTAASTTKVATPATCGRSCVGLRPPEIVERRCKTRSCERNAVGGRVDWCRPVEPAIRYRWKRSCARTDLALEIVDVVLEAPAGCGRALDSFYRGDLGLGAADLDGAMLAVRIGAGRLAFTANRVPGVEPFYHFALLVPGDRFTAAYEWLGAKRELLPDPETGDAIFDFDNWDAFACYCLDPVGNIVELIAHRGLSEEGGGGAFSPAELLGFSEVGIVGGDKVQVARQLGRTLGLSVWDGEIEDPYRLAFAGEKARTLILCPEGRPWLPTGRPAEEHRVELVIGGVSGADARLRGTPHLVRGGTRVVS